MPDVTRPEASKIVRLSILASTAMVLAQLALGLTPVSAEDAGAFAVESQAEGGVTDSAQLLEPETLINETDQSLGGKTSAPSISTGSSKKQTLPKGVRAHSLRSHHARRNYVYSPKAAGSGASPAAPSKTPPRGPQPKATDAQRIREVLTIVFGANLNQGVNDPSKYKIALNSADRNFQEAPNKGEVLKSFKHELTNLVKANSVLNNKFKESISIEILKHGNKTYDFCPNKNKTLSEKIQDSIIHFWGHEDQRGLILDANPEKFNALFYFLNDPQYRSLLTNLDSAKILRNAVQNVKEACSNSNIKENADSRLSVLNKHIESKEKGQGQKAKIELAPPLLTEEEKKEKIDTLVKTIFEDGQISITGYLPYEINDNYFKAAVDAKNQGLLKSEEAARYFDKKIQEQEKLALDKNKVNWVKSDFNEFFVETLIESVKEKVDVKEDEKGSSHLLLLDKTPSLLKIAPASLTHEQKKNNIDTIINDLLAPQNKGKDNYFLNEDKNNYIIAYNEVRKQNLIDDAETAKYFYNEIRRLQTLADQQDNKNVFKKNMRTDDINTIINMPQENFISAVDLNISSATSDLSSEIKSDTDSEILEKMSEINVENLVTENGDTSSEDSSDATAGKIVELETSPANLDAKKLVTENGDAPPRDSLDSNSEKAKVVEPETSSPQGNDESQQKPKTQDSFKLNRNLSPLDQAREVLNHFLPLNNGSRGSINKYIFSKYNNNETCFTPLYEFLNKNENNHLLKQSNTFDLIERRATDAGFSISKTLSDAKKKDFIRFSKGDFDNLEKLLQQNPKFIKQSLDIINKEFTSVYGISKIIGVGPDKITETYTGLAEKLLSHDEIGYRKNALEAAIAALKDKQKQGPDSSLTLTEAQFYKKNQVDAAIASLQNRINSLTDYVEPIKSSNGQTAARLIIKSGLGRNPSLTATAFEKIWTVLERSSDVVREAGLNELRDRFKEFSDSSGTTNPIKTAMKSAVLADAEKRLNKKVTTFSTFTEIKDALIESESLDPRSQSVLYENLKMKILSEDPKANKPLSNQPLERAQIIAILDNKLASVVGIDAFADSVKKEEYLQNNFEKIRNNKVEANFVNNKPTDAFVEKTIDKLLRSTNLKYDELAKELEKQDQFSAEDRIKIVQALEKKLPDTKSKDYKALQGARDKLTQELYTDREDKDKKIAEPKSIENLTSSGFFSNTSYSNTILGTPLTQVAAEEVKQENFDAALKEINEGAIDKLKWGITKATPAQFLSTNQKFAALKELADIVKEKLKKTTETTGSNNIENLKNTLANIKKEQASIYSADPIKANADALSTGLATLGKHIEDLIVVNKASGKLQGKVLKLTEGQTNYVNNDIINNLEIFIKNINDDFKKKNYTNSLKDIEKIKNTLAATSSGDFIMPIKADLEGYKKLVTAQKDSIDQHVKNIANVLTVKKPNNIVKFDIINGHSPSNNTLNSNTLLDRAKQDGDSEVRKNTTVAYRFSPFSSAPDDFYPYFTKALDTIKKSKNSINEKIDAANKLQGILTNKKSDLFENIDSPKTNASLKTSITSEISEYIKSSSSSKAKQSLDNFHESAKSSLNASLKLEDAIERAKIALASIPAHAEQKETVNAQKEALEKALTSASNLSNRLTDPTNVNVNDKNLRENMFKELNEDIKALQTGGLNPGELGEYSKTIKEHAAVLSTQVEHQVEHFNSFVTDHRENMFKELNEDTKALQTGGLNPDQLGEYSKTIKENAVVLSTQVEHQVEHFNSFETDHHDNISAPPGNDLHQGLKKELAQIVVQTRKQDEEEREEAAQLLHEAQQQQHKQHQ